MTVRASSAHGTGKKKIKEPNQLINVDNFKLHPTDLLIMREPETSTDQHQEKADMTPLCVCSLNRPSPTVQALDLNMAWMIAVWWKRCYEGAERGAICFTFLILRIFTGRFGGCWVWCVCLFVCLVLVLPMKILHSISVSN